MLASQNFANGHNATSSSAMLLLLLPVVAVSHKKKANLAHEASTTITTITSTTKRKKRKQQSCGKSIKYINLPRNVHGKRIKKLCCPAWWRDAAQWKI